MKMNYGSSQLTPNESYFDDVMVGLEWEDGVGSLPGSDLKFRKNGLGVFELIMEDAREIGNVEVRKAMINTMPTDENPFGTKLYPDCLMPSRIQEAGIDLSMKTKHKNIDNPDQFIKFGNNSGHNEDARSETIKSQQKSLQIELNNNFTNHNGSFQVQAEVAPSEIEKEIGVPNDVIFAKSNGVLNERTEFQKLKPSICKPKVRNFSWDVYLKEQNAIAAPEDVFRVITRKPVIPSTPNAFSVGDLLESVDPLHQYLICAVSVVEVKGYRLRLHFEGYSTLHDFWVNADDKLIFPCGFCEATGRQLQPPKGQNPGKFSWKAHSKETCKLLTTKEKFPEEIEKYNENHTDFEIGDKLEAVDRKNPALICAAMVIDIMYDLILIHFDGWNHNFDFWCDASSNYIHPVGWCKSIGQTVTLPINDTGDISWAKYLDESSARPAPNRAFTTRKSHGLEIGMKLEAVDRRNQILVRVASVVEKNNHQIKIHFDGWEDIYDYWIDVDSPDLHPPGWCRSTGHPLHPDITPEDKIPWQGACPVVGCRGIGHIKGSKFVGHHSEYGCPYSPKNLDSYPIQDRIDPKRGPKPSSLLSRRMMTTVKKMSPYEQGAVECRPFSLRRTSRNSVLDDGKAEQESNKPADIEILTTVQPDSPPVKRLANNSNRVRVSKREGRDPHYPAFRSSLWSSVPNKQLAVYWEQSTRLLPGMKWVKASSICKWTVEDVANFVREVTGNEEYAEAFIDKEIDGEAFLLLTQNDISMNMNIKLGPTLKIHSAILYARIIE